MCHTQKIPIRQTSIVKRRWIGSPREHVQREHIQWEGHAERRFWTVSAVQWDQPIKKQTAKMSNVPGACNPGNSKSLSSARQNDVSNSFSHQPDSSLSIIISATSITKTHLRTSAFVHQRN